MVPTAVIQPLHWVDDGVHFVDFACRKAAQSSMLVLRGLAVGGCERSAGRGIARAQRLSAAKGKAASQAAFLVIET